ncbi:MAG: membrane protein insertase YidC [Pelagibacterales bacterium MED-G40]|nr:MAG: membrane protein insertase YidC [Candidatus Pelagibacter sp. TMED203]PDH20445.1 MAG: membrane protein insertase YidC [Pelagibacterales bacterium MED-G40]|tara:strand:- start:43342 stop:45045 length:1704 start_codon:yes stop_codon:yes gene_type:complete
MEGRNVIVAIALSLSVILFWEAFMTVPKKKVQNNATTQSNQVKEESDFKKDDSITPSINETKIPKSISRNDSIDSVQRIKINNEKIEGSISLKGGIIDDVSFKNHKQSLEKNDNVVFLNPKQTIDGYFVETGWTSVGNKIKVPNINSNWKVKGNNVLSPDKPIILEWNNQEGLTFRKKINLDKKYLFNIDQEVQNNTNQTIQLFPYAQITRNKKPDDLMGFYILHEGFIGVFDEELKEDDYDDVEDKKIVREADSGWLGITDKYWVTAIVPPKNENFKSTFLFKDTFKANYILNNPINLAPSTTKNNQVRLFVAAKEVNTIDGYAESQNIEKFDLVIDWGWFYFFTKPLFFIIDYLFKLTGNFGVAIILITAAIRIIFFPLASYSFRSMAKMKALQPEMIRLKELHKEDKVKLQQGIMSLYKKEKVNPASGCLPILIQIPFFFAIYKMLYISLEMRHQPFFGWIKDLSAQDPTSIFNLFGLIPWDPPGFLIIGIWPILMGLTMFLQQKLNPAPTDPIQAKIFMFFPLFLTIILAPFPSGLVVYWTVNNILTIAQQWVIMRKTKVKTV